MTKKSAALIENYLEVVADIAFAAGHMVGAERCVIEDSRALMSDIPGWARLFEEVFDQGVHGDDYMELVDEYAVLRIQKDDAGADAFLKRMQAQCQKADRYDKGPHFAVGLQSFRDGKPRELPSYFTKPKGANAKAWFAGWDHSKSNSQVVQKDA